MEPYEIIWAEEALENINDIARYIGKNWSSTEVEQFFQLIREEEKILSVHPEAFRMINPQKQLRRTVVNRRTIIQYRVDQQRQQVQIVSAYDARSNPDRRHL